MFASASRLLTAAAGLALAGSGAFVTVPAPAAGTPPGSPLEFAAS